MPTEPLHREIRLRQRLVPTRAVPSPDDGPEAWLVEGLRGLSPHQRTAVALRYVDDLGVDEIAVRLRCRPGTARSHPSRATARRRTRRRRSVGAAMVMCVVVVAITGTLQLAIGPSVGHDAAVVGSVAAPTGALPDSVSASCAFDYDTATLGERDWARTPR